MSVIYMSVRTTQFVLFLLSFWLVYRIYKEKDTTKQKILLLASICAVLNIYGYLKFLLEHRPSKDMTDEQLEELAPWSENSNLSKIACEL